MATGLCFLQACHSKGKQEAEQETPTPKIEFSGARLVQVDSIMVDVMGAFKVYDYQPESQLFLGGDIGGFMIVIGSSAPRNEIGHVVFNKQGQILHQFNKANNGPEGHSPGAYDHAFLGPDAIGVMSKKALYRYGIDGTYQGKYPGINTLDLAGISNQRMLFSPDGKGLALGLPRGMEEAKKAWDSIYQILKPLWFYNLEEVSTDPNEGGNKGLQASYGYPDHPVYAPESKISTSTFPPLMAQNHRNNELYAVYPNIPAAQVYDISSGEWKGEIDLSPASFEVETPEGKSGGGTAGYEGLLWTNKGGSMANARYHQVTQLGDYTLYRYSRALPSSVINELVSSKSVLGRNKEWPRIRKKHYKFYYQLFKDGKKVLPDFELPILEPKQGDMEVVNYQSTRGEIIGGNGLDELYVYIPNTGQVERDYELIRVYKLELLDD